MASPSPEKPIRRAKVTYGKRKPVEDPDATLVPSAPTSFVARKHSMDEEIVPDSEPSHQPTSEESDAEDGAGAAKWDWQKKLAALDNEEEDATMVDAEERAATPLLSDHEQPSAFGTSLTALPGSPLKARDKGDSASETPYPRLSLRSLRPALDSSPATATPGEDSQDQTLSGSSPAQFAINTPQDASPESPPSSPAEDDHELPMAISKSSTSLANKAKGRRSVPPLSFDEETNTATASHSRKSSQAKDTHSRRSSKEKPKKVRAPSRVDVKESMKATARLRSDQVASIDSTTKPFVLANLIAKVQQDAKPKSSSHPSSSLKPHTVRQPQPRPLKATHSAHSATSDPIDEFSSSPAAHSAEISFTRDDSASPLDRLSSPAKPPGSPLQSNGLLSLNLFANKSKSQPTAYAKPATFTRLSAPDFGSTSASGSSSGLLSLGALPEDDDDDMPRLPSDSDEEMPDARSILQAHRKDKDLKAIKLRALEMQAARQSAGAEESDEDDDLQIVGDPRTRVREVEAERKLHPVRPNAAQQVQRAFALAGRPGAGDSPGKTRRKSGLTNSQLERAAKPHFDTPGEGRKGKGKDEGVSKEDLDARNWQKYNEERERVNREKEERWLSKGGAVQKVVEKKEVDVSTLLEAAQRRQSEGAGEVDEEEEGEEEDEEYVPGQEGSGEEDADEEGSTQGDAMDVEFDENEQLVHHASEADENDGPPPTAMDADSDEETQPAPRSRPRPRPKRPARKSAVISDSENENEPEDKENVKDVGMFEPGEDKENSVSASPSRSQGPRPLFGEFMGGGGSGMTTPRREGSRSPFKEIRTPSPVKSMFSPKRFGGLEDAFGDATQPSGVALGGLDDAFADATQPASAATQLPKGVAFGGLSDAFDDATQPASVATQPPKGVNFGGLDDAFDDATQPMPAATQAPKGVAFGGLADGFDDATQPPKATQVPKGVSFGGLEDGFEDATQPLSRSPRGVQFGGLADEFMDATQADGLDPAVAPVQAPEPQGFAALRARRDAPVALEEDRLRAVMPALDITATQKARYDRIFEQEQEDIIAAARPKPSKPVLYVNESGFLTQTRPEGDDVEVWQPSPTQRPAPASTMLPDLGPTPTQLRRIELSPTQSAPTPSRAGLNRAGSSTRRTPLGTLSVTTPGSGTMTGDDEDGTPLAPRRLFRKGERPMVRPESPTQPSRAKKAVSAYDEMEAAQKREREKRERKEFKKHRFAAEQAEESDDEMAFGFGGKKSDDEDDSDEDDDGRDLEGLVETREIDEEELARELVQEKVAEQEAADDAKIDKRVRDIATGKERQKRRRGGLDLEDSDDEDADKEERDRMRRDKMRNKKRKIAGDTLEGLGKQDETKPFYNVYYDHLEDTETVIEPLPEDDEEMADDDDGEDGDEEKPGVVAMSDLQAKLREVARSGKSKAPLFNPYDVSRLDEEEGSDDETPVNVRVVDAAPRAPLRRSTQTNDEDDDDFGYPRHRATQDADPSRHERDKKWMVEAGASGRAPARGTASTSITGNKSRKMPPPAAPKPKPVRKTESLLKGAMAQRKPALTRTGS